MVRLHFNATYFALVFAEALNLLVETIYLESLLLVLLDLFLQIFLYFLCLFDLSLQLLSELLIFFDLLGKRDLDTSLTLLELLDLGQGRS